MQQAASEREAFSQRLREALDRAGWRALGAASLAREYNARSGQAPITTHAARKWLHGEAIPTQERIRILAAWLEVSPEWLRFGSGAPLVANDPGDRRSDSAKAELLRELGLLDAGQLRAIRDLVRSLTASKRGA